MTEEGFVFCQACKVAISSVKELQPNSLRDLARLKQSECRLPFVFAHIMNAHFSGS